MGEVWAAVELRGTASRLVAVKLTRQQGAEAARVLWDEARIASQVHHPNAVQIYELGEHEGSQYLVMDFCDGTSLHDLLEATPGQKLPIPLAVRIVGQVAAGLHAAHELCDDQGHLLGVVHRDVSPQNILIYLDGRVAITDFGVAKAAGQAHAATATGEVKGKLSYMAPEQVRSRDVDRRADVFALGCVLYQTTLGLRPFHGADAIATLYQLLEEPLRPPRTIDPTYPPELEAIVVRALDKNRDHRYATTADMQQALERWLVSTGVRVRERDIAGLLDESFGDLLQRRRAAIQERLLQRTSRPPPLSPAARPPRGDSTSRLTLRSPPDSEEPPAKPSRRFPWAVLVAPAVLLASVVAWRAFLPAAKPALTVSVPTAEPPPVAAFSVVTVVVAPSAAKISWDGIGVGEGRARVQSLRGTEVHELRASAPGYADRALQVVADRDQLIQWELSPAVPATAAVPSSAEVVPPRFTVPRPAPTGNQVTTKGGSTPRPKLDDKNPFAEP